MREDPPMSLYDLLVVVETGKDQGWVEREGWGWPGRMRLGQVVRIWSIHSALLHHTPSVTNLSHYIPTLHYNSYYSTSFTDPEIVHL